MILVTVSHSRWANLNGSRGHWAKHQELMEEWKDIAALKARGAGLAQTPVTITATVHRTGKGRADAHNVTPTIKACIDGLVVAGVIPDDNDSVVRRLSIEAGERTARPTLTLAVASHLTTGYSVKMGDTQVPLPEWWGLEKCRALADEMGTPLWAITGSGYKPT